MLYTNLVLKQLHLHIKEDTFIEVILLNANYKLFLMNNLLHNNKIKYSSTK